MQNLEKLEKEIKEIILRSSVKTDLAHALSTKKWILKLKPDADIALQIAALAHDIERGFEPDYYNKTIEKFENYEVHKRIHSEKSAKIIVELLEKYRFDDSIIKKVERLVLNHEIGGDSESNLLMDADSISFFEENFVQYYEKYGVDKARKKIRFMYGRMSKKAQKLVIGTKYDNSVLNFIFKSEISNK
ncbi:MAG: DUF4202 family protein [Candidatus Aenigmarchaeota archaeon]|nr:DUF4202 family protein [Candidatus Aenigmarchaeota archaeon]